MKTVSFVLRLPRRSPTLVSNPSATISRTATVAIPTFWKSPMTRKHRSAAVVGLLLYPMEQTITRNPATERVQCLPVINRAPKQHCVRTLATLELLVIVSADSMKPQKSSHLSQMKTHRSLLHNRQLAVGKTSSDQNLVIHNACYLLVWYLLNARYWCRKAVTVL